MLKNPSIAFCSHAKFHGSHSLPQPSLTSSNARSENPQFRRIPHSHSSRSFATVRDDKSRTGHLPWPRTPSASAVPTPYQIFGQKKTDPYSKRRFYELVKLYHPDRHGHESLGPWQTPLPHSVMIDRYRLVVAANDILSHPTKRKAYDQCGAGWNGRPEAKFRRDQWSYDADGHWTGFEDNNTSPFRNATWEDWEKWYERNDGRRKKQPQKPVYFSNGAFLSLIATVACLGGIGQATRIGDKKISYLKQLETVHSDCSNDTRRRMEQAQGYGDADRRVKSFLRAREQAGVQVASSAEDVEQRLIPPPDPH